MWKILSAIVLLNLFVKGFAQALIVKVDGETTMRRKFCAGEKLIFLCTIRTSAYQWMAGTLLSERDGQVFVGRVLSRGRFTLSAHGVGDGRNSTMEVAAFSSLNGLLISCEEVGNPENSQTTMVTLQEMWCPTNISAEVYDNCSRVDVSLTVANCTQQYIVSISGNNNMPEISSSYLPMNNSGKLLNIEGFNLTNSSLSLCGMYKITAIAIFSDGSNMTCPTTSVVPTTSADPSSTTEQNPAIASKLSTTIIIIIAVVAVVAVCVLVIVIIIIIIVIYIKQRKKARAINMFEVFPVNRHFPVNQHHLNNHQMDEFELYYPRPFLDRRDPYDNLNI